MDFASNRPLEWKGGTDRKGRVHVEGKWLLNNDEHKLAKLLTLRCWLAYPETFAPRDVDHLERVGLHVVRQALVSCLSFSQRPTNLNFLKPQKALVHET